MLLVISPKFKSKLLSPCFPLSMFHDPSFRLFAHAFRLHFHICFAELLLRVHKMVCAKYVEHLRHLGNRRYPAETKEVERADKLKVREREIQINISLYIYIYVVKLLFWAKFGHFRFYYLGQVGVIIWAKLFFAYKNSGFKRFLAHTHTELSFCVFFCAQLSGSYLKITFFFSKKGCKNWVFQFSVL